MRPRVLHVADFHLKYAAGLARGMVTAGAAAALVTRDHAGEFGGDPAEMAHALDERLQGRVPLWTVGGRVRDRAALLQVQQLIARRRAFAPSVVHVQQAATNDPRLLAVGGVRPGRYAVTVHDAEVHPGDAAPPKALLAADRRLARHAGLVFVHADALVDAVLRWSGTKAPVEVVPHGADTPPVAPLPEQPTVLCFGRISAYKGVPVLLDAMERVWAAVPDARLMVVGEGELADHPALHDSRTTVRNDHVPERDVPGIFAEATVCALPYLEASQSGVGSRSKSYGRPLVVSRVGGLPELVADGSGLVVAPGDPQALAEATITLLRDREEAAAKGRAGAATLVADSGWDRIAERTLDAYRRHGLLS